MPLDEHKVGPFGTLRAALCDVQDLGPLAVTAHARLQEETQLLAVVLRHVGVTVLLGLYHLPEQAQGEGSEVRGVTLRLDALGELRHALVEEADGGAQVEHLPVVLGALLRAAERPADTLHIATVNHCRAGAIAPVPPASTVREEIYGVRASPPPFLSVGEVDVSVVRPAAQLRTAYLPRWVLVRTKGMLPPVRFDAGSVVSRTPLHDLLGHPGRGVIPRAVFSLDTLRHAQAGIISFTNIGFSTLSNRVSPGRKCSLTSPVPPSRFLATITVASEGSATSGL